MYRAYCEYCVSVRFIAVLYICMRWCIGGPCLWTHLWLTDNITKYIRKYMRLSRNYPSHFLINWIVFVNNRNNEKTYRNLFFIFEKVTMKRLKKGLWFRTVENIRNYLIKYGFYSLRWRVKISPKKSDLTPGISPKKSDLTPANM